METLRQRLRSPLVSVGAHAVPEVVLFRGHSGRVTLQSSMTTRPLQSLRPLRSRLRAGRTPRCKGGRAARTFSRHLAHPSTQPSPFASTRCSPWRQSPTNSGQASLFTLDGASARHPSMQPSPFRSAGRVPSVHSPRNSGQIQHVHPALQDASLSTVPLAHAPGPSLTHVPPLCVHPEMDVALPEAAASSPSQSPPQAKSEPANARMTALARAAAFMFCISFLRSRAVNGRVEVVEWHQAHLPACAPPPELDSGERPHPGLTVPPNR
jgi:hypothetical protein